MYIGKIEFFKSLYPEDNCVGGMIVANVRADLGVGSPCIACHSPFINCKATKELKIKQSIGQYFFENPLGDSSSLEKYPSSRRSRYKKKMVPEQDKIQDKMKMRELYKIAEEEGIAKANLVISESLNELAALFLFSLWSDGADFYNPPIESSKFFFNGTKPLIFDSCKRVELERLADSHDNEEMKSFADSILEELKRYRYINYTFMGVAKSNKHSMLEDLDCIYRTMKAKFPHNICFFQYNMERMRALLDTVSISFYKMSDVIPVFDHRKGSGIGMEIFLTNSEAKGESLMSHQQSATYRFLFSQSKENIFTIDGEAVHRPSDRPASQCMGHIYNFISGEVPNDLVLKKKKDNMQTLKKLFQEEV